MTIRNENLYFDLVLGGAVGATFAFAFVMAFVPILYALLCAVLFSVLFNWLHFRRHLYRMSITDEGTVELYGLRRKYWRTLSAQEIKRVMFLEGGMSVGAPRLKVVVQRDNAEMVLYLASRRRQELMAFLESLGSQGVSVGLA